MRQNTNVLNSLQLNPAITVPLLTVPHNNGPAFNGSPLKTVNIFMSLFSETNWLGYYCI